MIEHYKLEGKEIVQCESLFEWANWFETAKRHVADERILGVRVSTVFLGLDHGFGYSTRPVLFETMVFVGGWSEDEMRRYCTWEEAEEGHKEIVQNIKRHPWTRIVLPWIRFMFNRSRSKFENLIDRMKSPASD